MQCSAHAVCAQHDQFLIATCTYAAHKSTTHAAILMWGSWAAHFMMATVFLLRVACWVGCVWRSDASMSESPSIWNCVSSPGHMQTCLMRLNKMSFYCIQTKVSARPELFHTPVHASSKGPRQDVLPPCCSMGTGRHTKTAAGCTGRIFRRLCQQL